MSANPKRGMALAAGAALVALYVAAVTFSISGGWPARLLFDGVGPPIGRPTTRSLSLPGRPQGSTPRGASA